MHGYDQSQHLLSLVVKAQAGDEAAFEQLYHECYEPILRYIAFRVPTVDDAEDLAQQVFIRFYSNLASWKDQGYSPMAYIFTVARSVVSDYWRSNKNRPVSNSEDIIPLLVDNGKKPDEIVQSKQAVAEISRGINRLPDNYREVIVLRLIDGLSNPEISKIIGKSEVATRKLYSRGIQKLQYEIKVGKIDE
ncbi:sigma-70 family RNA polymerase sigma factor [Candidatus Saccharibacteria bacterium]|nr:sigma-70 family RNA polymerase sigma factor [Candidatus Saccharibacteria bacterium]